MAASTAPMRAAFGFEGATFGSIPAVAKFYLLTVLPLREELSGWLRKTSNYGKVRVLQICTRGSSLSGIEHIVLVRH